MNSSASRIYPPDVEPLLVSLRQATSNLDAFQMNERRRFPLRLVADLGRSGILGAIFSKDDGGLDLPERSALRLVEQAAAIDISLASFLVLHYTSSLPIAGHAEIHLRRRLMPELVAGRFLASLALTEPEAGSNPRAMRTSFARTPEGGYRIDGQKTWIGNGEWAAILTCFARGPDGRISAFVVDADASGITIEPELETLGLKATVQNPIRFDDVRIGADRLLGTEGVGLKLADEALSFGRLATGAVALGGMKRCAQIMGRFAARRRINTGLLLDNGVTRQRLVAVDGAITAVDALLDLILCEQEAGQLVPREALMLLKIAGSEFLWQTVDDTLQLLGSRGYAETNGIAALLRDSRFLRIGEGPTETLRMQVGAAIAHREPGLRTYFERIGGASAVDGLADLAAPILEIGATQRIESLYDRLGEAALWHLLALATERVDRSNEVARNWVVDHLAEASHRARQAPIDVGDADWEALIDACNADIGSLDESWPFPEVSRDPYLCREFAATAAPHSLSSEPQPASDAASDRGTRDVGFSTAWTPDKPLDPALVASVDEVARSRGTDRESLLLSAYVAFLSRLADTTEVEVVHGRGDGTTAASRGLRVEIGPGASIDVILRSVSEWIRPTVLHLLRFPTDRPMDRKFSAAFTAFKGTSSVLPEAVDQSDLILLCLLTKRSLVLRWRYDPNLFDATTIERRHTSFEIFLAAALSDPVGDVRHLKILAPGERKLVVDRLNAPMTDPCYHHHTLHGLFAQQVDRTPDAVAIESPHERLTYAALEARANRLARGLRAWGLRPGQMVAVMTSRSPMAVVGLLGVLKADGCFVILNSSHPIERRARMLEETEARFIVVDPTTVGDVPETEAEVVIESNLVGLDDSRPSTVTRPDNIAYVMYTSGSTGRPKAVLIPHRAIVNHFLGRRDQLDLGPDERVLHTAAPSFDIAIWELLGPLVFGGCIVMSGAPDFSWDPAHVLHLIEEQRVTIIQIVPSQLSLLLNEMGPGRGTSLRHVLCGGEPLTWDVQERFFENVGGNLYNFYGTTEGTIDSTYWRCERDDRNPVAPIGRGTVNCRLYVLDPHSEPVPFGVPGELVIGGVGVAAGYLGLPDLTAKKFLTDPFVDDPNARMYRTGDRVRYRAHGVLEFLGRIDRQIKIRGVRIEPDEIEIIMANHPRVAGCAVAIRKTPAGDKTLVAYVAAADTGILSGSELRAHARMCLPAEMIPNAFVVLDDLPRTANGKVDIEALPPVDWSVLAAGEALPLSGSVETKLAAIWSGVLGIPVCDAGANFFELGGHSLSAVNVLSRVSEIFGVELPISEFFDHPMLRDMAGRLGTVLIDDSMPDLAVTQPAPLSFAQESLWFLDRLGDAGAYNEFEGVRLTGTLNIEALRLALGDLVARHDIMRTVLADVGGTLCQVVRPPADIVLPVVDLSGFSADRREQRLLAIAQREAIAPFDLAAGPLVRFRLVALSRDEHALLITIHHVCGDGWSLGLLSRELETLYTARTTGRQPDLRPLAIQYTDYARWQREQLSGDRLERGVSWWQERLAGLPPLLDLSLDHPRPAVRQFHGADRHFEFGPEFSERLHALGKRCQVTPFMTALTAFAVLLHHYTGMEDFAIGSPFANRSRRDFEELIGFFANSVVLRVNVSNNPTVRELLGRFRRTTLEAYEYADIPFEKVVEAVAPERYLSYNPLFQVIFSWQLGRTLADLALPNLSVEPLGIRAHRAKFDLNVVVSDSTTTGIHGRWEYDTDLFDEATIDRMIARYRIILEQMIADPDRPVREIDLLSDAERIEVTTRWAARANYADERTIVDLFAEQAARCPKAVALISGEHELTYRELDQRAKALAGFLRGLGVGPEKRVGLLLDRSAELVVAILGILQAGGAYVPIDPLSPTDRVTSIARDAGIVVLLTESSLLDCWPPDDDTTVVVLDRDREEILAATPIDGLRADASCLAYVIYTSGSTGVPKGVQIEHRQVVRLLAATDDWFGFSPDDVWSLFHSPAFDFSVWEIWGALLHGARIVVVPYTVSRSPQLFYRFLVEHGVTVLNQTPSAFGQLSRAEESLGTDPDLALRLIIFGGEALDFNTLEPWFERHGDQVPRLVNMYGITETTVHVTYRPISLNDVRARRGSLIGEPIPDLELLILDELCRPVPIGIPGELYVGGAGLARGYLNRPELTAERFIAHPLDPTRRLYRTGDWVRARADGDIEYLGRIDHQVQLRGYRIELGEVEAGLTELPGILEAVAIVREDVPGDKRLVAYVVSGDQAPSSAALREHLAGKLPRYMMPSAIVSIDHLSLTLNGKVDYAALPRPVLEGTDRFGPRNETEASLIVLWTKLLGARAIGVRDSFFDLGGHSLLAVVLLSEVEARFGRPVPLPAFFAAPTIEGLATAIASSEPAFSPAVTLRDGGEPLFCFPGSGGMIAALDGLARELNDRSFIAMQRPGLDGSCEPYRTVEAMAVAATEAIFAVQPVGPYTLVGHSFGAWVAYEVGRRLAAAGHQVARLAVLDMPAPSPRPLARSVDPERLLGTFATIVEAISGFPLSLDPTELNGADPMTRFDSLSISLAAAGILPAGGGPDHIRGMMRVLEADEEALAAYAVSTPASFPIDLFSTGGTWDGESGPSAEPSDTLLGWRRLTTGPVTAVPIAGNHSTMLAMPHVVELARALDDRLSSQ